MIFLVFSALFGVEFGFYQPNLGQWVLKFKTYRGCNGGIEGWGPSLKRRLAYSSSSGG